MSKDVVATNPMLKFDGACVRRVVDRSGAEIPEHAHDWPVLSIFVIGAYWNRTEIGEMFIDGPSAVLYRGRVAHRNTVGSAGFEQLEIEFDPAWLGHPLPADAPVVHWVGGRSGAEARQLAHRCLQPTDESGLRSSLRRFIGHREARHEPAAWVGRVTQRLKEDASVRICDLAGELGLHPSWLGSAYKRAAGEGVQEAAARFRVERAARQLRETDEPYAAIAVDAGFCDQGHMNRSFRRVLGRLPSAVRGDRLRPATA
jgi:AraC-like DNA-binding protein